MVGEQLHRDRQQHGRQQVARHRHREHGVGLGRQLAVALVADGDDAAIAGPHLLEIAHHPVVRGITRVQCDHRKPVLEQRDRPVLHLAGGVALRVHVGELLELERALQRERIVDAAAQEQEVLVARELAGQLRDRVLHLEGLLHEAGQLEQALDVLASVLREQGAAAPAQPEAEEVAGDQGRGEGLGGGDPDLGPRVSVEGAGGLAGERGADHVGDAHDGGPLGPRGLDRPEGVGGLARLGYGHDQGLGPHHRVPVAELGADVDLAGDAGQTLQHEAAHDGRVVGGAARHQDDALQPRDDVGVELHVREHHRAALEVHAAPHGVGGGPRLLEDLLQHEMAIAALLGHDRIPQDAARRPLHRRPVEIGDLDPGAGDDRHVLVLQHHHVAGVGEDGRDVGGEEGLVVAEPHHHAARAELGRHQPVRHAPVQHHDGVGAAQLPQGAAYRLVEARRVLEVALHQVGDDLGVGLGPEDVPLRLQALLDRQVVLDDAVVHHHQLARPVGVRVRVLVGGAAVGGPAGVPECRWSRRWAARGGCPPDS